MLRPLRKLLRPRATRQSAIPPGERVYAVGDIHGRLDLLTAMIEAIEADDGARGDSDTTVILLGDLVDRGPHSAQVIAAARQWRSSRKVRILCGNHEDMLLGSLGKEAAFRQFLKAGGMETVLSYLPRMDGIGRMDIAEMQDLFRTAVPAQDIAFVSAFEDIIEIGDYLFVHAGILPGVAPASQDPLDLRWIREPFLSYAGDHGRIVVHGHTITENAEFRKNRIGIDTGAFASGRLTALGLEGTERWLIEVRADEPAERPGQNGK